MAAPIIEVIMGLSMLKYPCPVIGLTLDKIEKSMSCLSFSKLSDLSSYPSSALSRKISNFKLLIVSKAEILKLKIEILKNMSFC
jgi:hypothetical protein